LAWVSALVVHELERAPPARSAGMSGKKTPPRGCHGGVSQIRLPLGRKNEQHDNELKDESDMHLTRTV
jgi:hypothetical protein